MASTELKAEITRLESRLTSLRAKIEAQEAVKEMEEGGAGARFRTQFTSIDILYAQEQELLTRLQTLKNYVAAGR